jgi:hypothetical protein
MDEILGIKKMKSKTNIEVKERPILFSGDMVRALRSGRKTQTRRIVKDRVNSDTGRCPYGKVQEKLWVRETWADYLGEIVYRADEGLEGIGFAPESLKWKPSIFMPRSASRITLEITDIRVERLQDISEEDAIAEGIMYEDHYSRRYFDSLAEDYSYKSPIDSYQSLWDSINGDKHPWESNCWVWVISFRRMP